MRNTKERIQSEALRLFAENGYHAVTVEQIAAAVGIKAPSLYKHYSGKRAIFDGIVHQMEARDLQQARRYQMPEENGTAEKSLPAKACHGRTSALQRKFITALFSRSRKYAASHASEMSCTAWRAGHSRQSGRNVIFFFSVVSISGILHRPVPDDNR